MFEKRCEAAAKAQYEKLLNQVWEEETLENRVQWIESMRSALNAADAFMVEHKSMGFTAELLASMKFPNKDWDDLHEDTKKLFYSSAETITKATQGRF